MIKCWRARRTARLLRDMEIILRVLSESETAYGLDMVEAGVRGSHLYVALATLEGQRKITSRWDGSGRRIYRLVWRG